MSSREGKRPVPKFSSFKPRSEPAPPHREVAKDHESRRRAEEASHHAHSQDQHQDQHRPLVVASEGHSGPHNRASPQGPAHREVRGVDGLFVLDKRGDSLIRRYGTNNRHDIPEYRRIGSGRILGTDGFMRIERVGNHDEFFVRGHHEARSLFGGNRKSLFTKAAPNKSQIVRVRRDESQTVTGNEDFLSLRPSKRRKHDHDSSGELSGDEGPSYRSIHGKAKPHEHSDGDEDYGTDSSTDSNLPGEDNATTTRSIELSRRAREHPEDIDAWLQLVDHQDVLLGTVSTGGRRPTLSEVKSYADIKLSMLEQALSHATADPQRVVLHLRIMREGAKIWDYKRLEERWKDVMLKHGSDFGIWRAYMNFRQATLPTFQYDEIKKLYVERLQFTKDEIKRLPASSNPVHLYEQMIYVFSRATRFVADAGFPELGTALWQAALELAFAGPETGPETNDTSVPLDFETFWESEVPRLGEDRAQGWAAFRRNAGTQKPPEPKATAQPPAPNTRDAYRAWSMIEQNMALTATLPARTLDEGAEDDPYRVVMYGDIHDMLLYIPTHVILCVRRQLLDAFLMYAQLPPASDSSRFVHDALRDDFIIRSSTESFVTPNPPSIVEADHDHNEHTKPPEFSHVYQSMRKTSDVLFPSSHWFRYVNSIRENIPLDQYRWISNTLKQLVRSFGVKELAPYYLAFESINESGSEKKTAKALLKQDPTNVDLYEGYAILEWVRSNKSAARNVVAAAVGSPAITDHDHCRLRITWAWMELEDGALAKGALRLCALAEDRSRTSSLPEDEPATPSQVLKARQLFISSRDYLLSSGDPEHAIIYAEALALLEYLTGKSNKEPSSENQGDIWSATTSVSTCSDEFISRHLTTSQAHEKLLQFAARLLYFHASRGPFRPGFLRERLTKYVGLFPRNTVFLSLLAWKETRLSIDDRVRSVLDTTVLVEPHDCVSSRAFAIRYEARVGNVHSTRAAFERALESEACRHHLGLWISYVRFCYGSRELRSKAKDVFYRAIQNCPWSKDVFLEAFVTLGREMDSSELRSVYNTLCDRGLRVHVEMPEFIDRWRREQKEKYAERR
ncbi:hypothetical protein DL762_009476 [Monosporascus cannonballus]|uniref:DUF1740-domain-containing protein n=1 Tax=Monosporascus cannonballus TaxID=155416 RepID=A0ABY0GT91_9PEZI|nr:hypothetical protein DL762_009476 [Monosporascus cannonballus]